MANPSLDFSGLTVDRTYTFPDGTGTIALDIGSTNIVTVGTITTGVWHGTKIGLAYGGTNADLSGTGGASQVLQQASAGAAVTVGQLAGSDLSDADFGANNVVTTGKVLTTAGLGVGNSAAATTPGTVQAKVEVFDAAGVSIGFVAVYDAIT